MDLQNAHKSGETETEESWVAIWGGSCGWVQEADQKGTSHHESGEVDREVVLALMFPWAPSGHACTHHHCSACRNIAASPGLPAEGNPQGSTESWVESRCQGRRLPSFLPSGAREEVGTYRRLLCGTWGVAGPRCSLAWCTSNCLFSLFV